MVSYTQRKLTICLVIRPCVRLICSKTLMRQYRGIQATGNCMGYSYVAFVSYLCSNGSPRLTTQSFVSVRVVSVFSTIVCYVVIHIMKSLPYKKNKRTIHIKPLSVRALCSSLLFRYDNGHTQQTHIARNSMLSLAGRSIIPGSLNAACPKCLVTTILSLLSKWIKPRASLGCCSCNNTTHDPSDF